jgi:hypothetical protein
MADFIRQQKERARLGQPLDVFHGGRASGRGIGKSALLGIISHWMQSTVLGSTVIVSANGEPQLRTVTFPEMNKWFTLGLNSHWFDATSLQITVAPWLGKLLKDQRQIDPKYYYVQGKLWTEENPSAYAGPHSSVGMMVIFDEASGIPAAIWDNASGFLTDPTPYRFWLAFSNPRQNSGGFYDRFHKPEMRQFWRLGSIDSRTVEGTDKLYFDRLVAQYGEDSDVVRVEVLGQFPSAGDRQFIANDIVDRAREREVLPDRGAALVMGVDISRHGDDFNVVRFRQGNDARSIPPFRWKNPDTTVTADRLAELIHEYKPDAVCIDIGMGGPVGDMLRRRGFRRIHLVDFGGKANNPVWPNKGTEMYAEIREWLREGGCIDGDDNLYGDLVGRQFEFFGPGKDKIKLEAKDNFRTRSKRSPDDGDALALTFAVKAARRDLAPRRQGGGGRIAEGLDYNLFG